MTDQLAADIPRGAWLTTARGCEPASWDVPTGDGLDELLVRLSVRSEDRAELPARLAEVAADPSLRWIADRFTTWLRGDIGGLALPSPHVEPRRAWPVLPPSMGPAARCAYLPGFLSTVEQIRDVHRSRGIPDETSWATLADFGRHLWIHRRTYGVVGVDTHWWLTLVWTGGLVDVGRLQGEWIDERTVNLHIPEGGPFTPEAIDASLAQIRAEWPRWFGTRPERGDCESWLLDPRLAEVLPETSNIVRFQRRFTLYDGGYVDDQNPLYFVFRRRGVPLPEGLASLPRDTTLQRAILDQLEAGGHWTVRKGWLAL